MTSERKAGCLHCTFRVIKPEPWKFGIKFQAECFFTEKSYLYKSGSKLENGMKDCLYSLHCHHLGTFSLDRKKNFSCVPSQVQ